MTFMLRFTNQKEYAAGKFSYVLCPSQASILKRKPVSITDELGPLKFLLRLKQMFLAQIGWWANKFLCKVVKPKVNEIGNFCLTRR